MSRITLFILNKSPVFCRAFYLNQVMDSKLPENEILFCELYVNGSAPYAGNAAKCYSEVFKCDSKHTKHLAKQLLMREDIQAFLKELDENLC